MALSAAAADIEKARLMQEKLNTAYQNKAKDYQPRTRHFKADGSPQFINALILENSPYLLQHAHNPVNWHAWSDSSLQKARLKNKLIFLSIGYATCHWCHVMEEQSFESKAVAKALNQDFISIKVDREVRPDVDEVFMAAVQTIGGHGGWPLNVILTPDGRAFFGGTYFTKTQLLSLLAQVQDLWQKTPNKVLAQADSLQAVLEKQKSTNKQVKALNVTAVEAAIYGILAGFDELEGGFGQAPKFPHEGMLLLLLDAQKRQPTAAKLNAIDSSLSAMAQGGFYDVIAGGFARYSTDNSWLVPHFEKMLYNQAQLSLVYIYAFELTKNPLYERVARQTLDYVLAEMQSKKGGFYSATDADSEGEEGTFFVWDLKEIKQILGDLDFLKAQKIFDFSEYTLFEGKHIIRYQPNLTPADYQYADTLIKRLYQARQKRIKPLLDNKILLSWNAMMVRALLKAGQVFDDDNYRKSAKKSFNFLKTFAKTNSLNRVLLNQHYGTDALLEDYAHFIILVLDNYDETADKKLLLWAKKLTNQAIDKFWDVQKSGFFSHQSKQLYLRNKTAEDGAIISSNGVLLSALIKLSIRSGNDDRAYYAQHFLQLLDYFSADMIKNGAYYATMIRGLMLLQQGQNTNIQWLYQGKVRAQLTHQKHNYQLNIHLPDGYYINSHQPKQADLIATSVANLSKKQWQMEAVQYPKSSTKKLPFSADKLTVYKGNVQINFTLKPKLSSFVKPKLSLTLQACNAQLCLPPNTLIF